jgi:hypothetical protein
MNASDIELTEYLLEVFGRRVRCESEDCPSCSIANGVFEYLRSRMFNGTRETKKDVAAVSTAQG